MSKRELVKFNKSCDTNADSIVFMVNMGSSIALQEVKAHPSFPPNRWSLSPKTWLSQELTQEFSPDHTLP